MNQELTNQIIKHLLNNLGVTDKRSASILFDELVIDQKISYEHDDKDYTAKVWACQSSVSNVKITIAYTQFTFSAYETESVLLVNMENCPLYGCYLSINDLDEKRGLSNGNISFSVKDNIWLEATTFMQASFLAGMEQLKDLTVSFDKCKDTQKIFDALVSFIEYYDALE